MTPHDTARQWAFALAAIAKRKKITQKSIAAKCNKPAMTISHVFKGNRVASSETLAAIAGVLEVELEWVEISQSNAETP